MKKLLFLIFTTMTINISYGQTIIIDNPYYAFAIVKSNGEGTPLIEFPGRIKLYDDRIVLLVYQNGVEGGEILPVHKLEYDRTANISNGNAIYTAYITPKKLNNVWYNKVEFRTLLNENGITELVVGFKSNRGGDSLFYYGIFGSRF